MKGVAVHSLVGKLSRSSVAYHISRKAASCFKGSLMLQPHESAILFPTLPDALIIPSTLNCKLRPRLWSENLGCSTIHNVEPWTSWVCKSFALRKRQLQAKSAAAWGQPIPHGRYVISVAWQWHLPPAFAYTVHLSFAIFTSTLYDPFHGLLYRWLTDLASSS